MVKVRKSHERGHFDHGWLDTYHTFSFGLYHDPSFLGYGPLRVINEDRVKPDGGFPMHGHRDMEIITWVLEGELEHKDSTGGGSIIRPGEAQRMTAGTGIMHSEFNPSGEHNVHLLQIWIEPRQRGYKPGYDQKSFSDEQRSGRLCLLASPDESDGALTIQQDARVYDTVLAAGESVELALVPGRRAWVQMARGRADLNGQELNQGDGAAVSDETLLKLSGLDTCEVLIFDLP